MTPEEYYEVAFAFDNEKYFSSLLAEGLDLLHLSAYDFAHNLSVLPTSIYAWLEGENLPQFNMQELAVNYLLINVMKKFPSLKNQGSKSMVDLNNYSEKWVNTFM